MGVDAEMVIRLECKPSREDVLRWSWSLCESIGAEHFWLDAAEGRSALLWLDDADEDADLHAPYGAGLYVQTFMRYYGEGYERGDLLVICAIAEWAEQNIPGASVEYGGDCNDSLTPFGRERREQLRAHLYGHAGRAYYKDRPSEPSYPKPPRCGICKPSGPEFHRCGFGANYCAVSCAGCGKSWTSHDHGATFVEGGTVA